MPVRDPATDSLLLESVLIAAESIITYRRRYRSQAQVETVLDLLVLDADNPRSLAFQLDRLAEAVARLPRPTAATVERESKRLVEELATVVALADTDELARVDDAGATTGGRRAPLAPFLDQRPGAAHRAGRAARRRPLHPSAARSASSRPARRSGPVLARPERGGAVTYRVVHRTEYRYDSRGLGQLQRGPPPPAGAPGQQSYSADARPSTRSPRTTASAATSSATASRTSRSTSPTRRSPSRPPRSSRSATGARSSRALGDQPWEQARDRSHATTSAETIDARQFVLDSPLGRARRRRRRSTPRASFAAGRPLVDAVVELSHRIHDDFEFTPGATTISTPIDEVLDRRAGVCQDFAHLAIGAAPGPRASPPATSAATSRPSRRRAGPGWSAPTCPTRGCRCSCPTSAGSTSIRPTTSSSNDRYVTVAWGRDYADVPPLKGVIFTEGKDQQLEVTVDVDRDPRRRSLAGRRGVVTA